LLLDRILVAFGWGCNSTEHRGKKRKIMTEEEDEGSLMTDQEIEQTASLLSSWSVERELGKCIVQLEGNQLTEISCETEEPTRKRTLGRR
jgi:hypothetical protein